MIYSSCILLSKLRRFISEYIVLVIETEIFRKSSLKMRMLLKCCSSLVHDSPTERGREPHNTFIFLEPLGFAFSHMLLTR